MTSAFLYESFGWTMLTDLPKSRNFAQGLRIYSVKYKAASHEYLSRKRSWDASLLRISLFGSDLLKLHMLYFGRKSRVGPTKGCHPSSGRDKDTNNKFIADASRDDIYIGPSLSSDF
jgi:hypothetical protein